MPKSKASWKIFIVTHGPIVEKYYKNDHGFSNEHFAFINVADTIINHPYFNVINKKNIIRFVNLGKWYAEAEAIYNMFLLKEHEKYDYIGFIHWDYELSSPDDNTGYNITQTIESKIGQNVPFISFSSYHADMIYQQKIMMDERYPDQKIGNGTNCMDIILEDYNRHFATAIKFDDIRNRRMNLCSAFLCRKDIFEHMLKFYCAIIEEGKINKFDTQHKYRFQGGLLERYIGIYTTQIDFAEIELTHHYNHAKEASSFPYLLGKYNLLKYKTKQSLFNIKVRLRNLKKNEN